MTAICIGKQNFEQINELLPHAEMIELRLDLMDLSDLELVAILNQPTEKIITLRDYFNFSKQKHFFEICLRNKFEFIDVEFKDYILNRDFFTGIINQTEAKLILSFHDFRKTDSPDVCREKINEMMKEKCDYVKFVSAICSEKDYQTIINLQKEFPGQIIFGMGELGSSTRISSYIGGAPFIYASDKKDFSVAPGQLDYREVAEELKKKFKPKIKLLGVAGKPVSHSRSPYLFNPVLDKNYFYLRISADNPGDIIESDLPFVGINITSPFKSSIIPYSRHQSESVKITKAANCFRFKDNSVHNTDPEGVYACLREYLFTNAKIAVLGAGGAAKAVCSVLKRMAYDFCIFNRTFEKANIIAENFGGKAYPLNKFYDLSRNFDVIVSALSQKPNDIKYLNLKPGAVFSDAIYHKPFWKKFLPGNTKYIDGKKWLINQAKYSFKLFIPEKSEELTINSDLKEINNFALIGLSGSGKSYLAEKINLSSGRKIINLDKEIEKNTQMTIRDIFKQKGENYFREKETELLEKYLARNSVILDCGGGVILSEQNRKLLKKSYNIWIYRNIDELISDKSLRKSRPLYHSVRSILNQYKTRIPLYAETADLLLINKNIKKSEELLNAEINNLISS